VYGTVHARCCHWLATSIHFDSNLAAHGTRKRNWVPQTTRSSPAGVQKLNLNEIDLRILCCLANFNFNACIFNFVIDLTLEHENILWASTPLNYISNVSLMANTLFVQLQPLSVTSSPIIKQHMTLKIHVILLTFSLGKWWRKKTSILQ